MISSPPVGAIAFGKSGIGCTVIQVEVDRLVLDCPDGMKRVPLRAIARWEMPTLKVGDRVEANRYNQGWQSGSLTALPIEDANPNKRISCWKVRFDDGLEEYIWSLSNLRPLSEA